MKPIRRSLRSLGMLFRWIGKSRATLDPLLEMRHGGKIASTVRREVAETKGLG